ncbi:M20 family metallopeptidase [Bradyrhizobium sp. AUGA SZCCT0042]|uniref:M20 family metallopeptidase n=1 Tax=Bradyrhizobium sp. AUGA SZCCT0042 TaxID=2807651 RepID=UPI001BA5E958|nr:M20 family metallopeptidase [Bradyrhizobium sp. AUGA SZCCT0042]MBR1301303.1 M20 family metallopeptidase [Bradyrhizobium sp. AUGA SZCCT0042]
MPERLQQPEAESILAGLRRWVEIETPTGDVESMARLLDVVAADFAQLGASLERIPGRDGMGDHLLIRLPWGSGPGILSVSHLDTVCPPGSIAMRRDGDRFHGPGIADMKAGGYLAFKAAEHIAGLVHQPSMPLTLLYTSDEEIGSPTSRGIIERLARESRYALIAEPARRDEVITFRKGRAKYRLDVEGREAHAGSAHANGRSAISEIACQIIRLDQLTDYATGTTINVGEVGGGTTPNVVAGRAFCTIDVRFSTPEAGRMVDETVLSVSPIGSDVTVTASGEIEKPCLERTAGGLQLFGLAKLIASEQDIDLIETSSGGGSDGNFTSAVGIPTLDGLGAIGNEWHSPNEYVVVSALPRRAELLRRMFTDLGS